MITALLIKKGTADWVTLKEDVTPSLIKDFLETEEMISSSVRYLGMYRFRVYHKDYVVEPEFFTAVNPDNTPDIPEQCLIILTETFGDEETFLDLHSFARVKIKMNLLYYNIDNIQQPIIKWKISNSF